MAQEKISKKDKEIANHPNVKGRVLPQNDAAEQAVLGSILLSNADDAAMKVTDGLKSSDFVSIGHQVIFDAMYTLAVKDKPIDLITLFAQLDENGTRDKAGGVKYVNSLTNIVKSEASYKHYRDIVKKTALLRRLIAASGKIMDNAFAGDPDNLALQMAETEIYRLGEQEDKSSLQHISVGLNETIAAIEKIAKDPKALRGVPTPYKELNRLLGGLNRTDLILIAARPGQGKTSIGMNLISHAALANVRKTDAGKPNPFRCAVFSLEMPAAQLAKRMMCSIAGLDMSVVNSGELSKKNWEDIFFAKERLSDAKLYIDDSSLTTPIEILSKCRRLKREGGLDLVMIDYLQLMSSGKRVENRQQEISEITRTLKIAAKELDVPILLLSQMSREIEKRQDKTPQMSDLRESGAIEQDADIIIFIYRKYDANDESVDIGIRNKVELHIAKHRNGSTGKIDLLWDGPTVSFKDYNGKVFVPPNIANKKSEEKIKKEPTYDVGDGYIPVDVYSDDFEDIPNESLSPPPDDDNENWELDD